MDVLILFTLQMLRTGKCSVCKAGCLRSTNLILKVWRTPGVLSTCWMPEEAVFQYQKRDVAINGYSSSKRQQQLTTKTWRQWGGKHFFPVGPPFMWLPLKGASHICSGFSQFKKGIITDEPGSLLLNWFQILCRLTPQMENNPCDWLVNQW